jgi:hypothetical protein
MGLPLFASSSVQLAATASSGGGANAVVNLPAAASKQWTIENVIVSYTTTSSGGGLNVYAGTSSGAVICAVDVLQEGVTAIQFGGLSAGEGNAMTVELLQPGSSIIGRLNVYGRLR